MIMQLSLSSEFAALVKQLHSSPQDVALKQAVLKLVPEMKQLAQTDSLALYRLAQIYPLNSPTYKHMMNESAQLGCSHAMLAFCELVQSSTDTADLKKVAQYLQKIQDSNDSYASERAQTLLETHPHLKEVVKNHAALDSLLYGPSFFPNKQEKTSAAEEVHSNGLAI